MVLRRTLAIVELRLNPPLPAANLDDQPNLPSVIAIKVKRQIMNGCRGAIFFGAVEGHFELAR